MKPLFFAPKYTHIKRDYIIVVPFLSGYQDSNLGPPAPKAGALTGLRYIPKHHCERYFSKAMQRYGFFLNLQTFHCFFCNNHKLPTINHKLFSFHFAFHFEVYNFVSRFKSP